jgi:hypothetical protein
MVVLLHTPLVDPAKLESFVEDCLKRGVKLIAISGPDAAITEDMVDELIVGDGSDKSRFIVTSSHPDEPFDDVLDFAASWDGGSAVREVRL